MSYTSTGTNTMQDDIHGGYSQIQVTEGIEYWKQSISQSIHNFQESIINNQLINQLMVYFTGK